MHAWTYIFVIFIVGCILGVVSATILFRAKLKVYQRFIESRLDTLNMPFANRVFRSGQTPHARKEDARKVAGRGK